MNTGIEGYTPKPGEDVSFETIQVGPAYVETLSMQLVDARLVFATQPGPRRSRWSTPRSSAASFPTVAASVAKFGFNADAPGHEIVWRC